jgi:hypothetical protein
MQSYPTDTKAFARKIADSLRRPEQSSMLQSLTVKDVMLCLTMVAEGNSDAWFLIYVLVLKQSLEVMRAMSRSSLPASGVSCLFHHDTFATPFHNNILNCRVARRSTHIYR